MGQKNKLGVNLKNKKPVFPGGPVVKSPSFHCGGRRVDPSLGN